jgi:hypothetical protein
VHIMGMHTSGMNSDNKWESYIMHIVRGADAITTTTSIARQGLGFRTPTA